MKNITTILVLAALLMLSACSKVTPGGNAVTVKAGCTYRGGTADGLPDGYGVLARGDSAAGTHSDGNVQGGHRCERNSSRQPRHLPRRT